MTKGFVQFVCPAHGPVMQATPCSRVEHSCGKECAPEGLTLAEHLAVVRKDCGRR